MQKCCTSAKSPCYDFLRHGSLNGAVMTRPSEMPTAAWTYYFRVPDIDAAVDTATANGGQVFNGPHEIPGVTTSLTVLTRKVRCCAGQCKETGVKAMMKLR